MKVIAIIFAIAAIVLVSSQLLCGLWLAAKGATTEGRAFHRKLGIGASVVTLLTAISAIVVAS